MFSMLHNDTEDDLTDYMCFDVKETRINETEIDTNNNIGSSDGNQNATAWKNFRVNETWWWTGYYDEFFISWRNIRQKVSRFFEKRE